MPQRTRADSPSKTCTADGCDKPLRARGYCIAHYNATQYTDTERHPKQWRTCVTCGEKWLTWRPDGKYCSELCYHYDKWGARSKPLPARHPVTRIITALEAEPVIETQVYRIHFPTCAWCGEVFLSRQPHAVTCSRYCQKRRHRAQRKAREHGAVGVYTWAEVTRLFLLFDRRCAYCDQPVEGQPDPDHVLALSRGGANSITNILPSCRMCNCEKQDMTLDEWRWWRQDRDLPPRVTFWRQGDCRVRHLVLSQPTRPRTGGVVTEGVRGVPLEKVSQNRWRGLSGVRAVQLPGADYRT